MPAVLPPPVHREPIRGRASRRWNPPGRALPRDAPPRRPERARRLELPPWGRAERAPEAATMVSRAR